MFHRYWPAPARALPRTLLMIEKRLDTFVPRQLLIDLVLPCAMHAVMLSASSCPAISRPLPVDHPRAQFKERLNKRQKRRRGVVTRALPSKTEACTQTFAGHADCEQSAVIDLSEGVDLHMNNLGEIYVHRKYIYIYR